MIVKVQISRQRENKAFVYSQRREIQVMLEVNDSLTHMMRGRTTAYFEASGEGRNVKIGQPVENQEW